MTLFDLVLPDLWIVANTLPKKEGDYICRIREEGEYKIERIEFREGEFKTKAKVIAWKE